MSSKGAEANVTTVEVPVFPQTNQVATGDRPKRRNQQSAFKGGVQLKLGRTRSKPTLGDINALRDELKAYEISSSDITVSGEIIGGGKFGEVRCCTWKNSKVAVKTIYARTSDVKFLREVKMMSRVNHPRIVRFFGFCMRPNRIVMELAESGSLKDILNGTRLGFSRCLKYAIEIANGLCYLHGLNPPIVHRDLKPENILITSNGCRIADFGISAEVHGKDFGTMCGTNWYMAPEVILAQQYGEKADIFSFAIVLWEMLSGNEPYKEVKNQGFFLHKDIAENQKRPKWPIPEIIPLNVRAVVEECWQHKSNLRPSMDEVVKKLEKLQKGLDNQTSSKANTLTGSISEESQILAPCNTSNQLQNHATSSLHHDREISNGGSQNPTISQWDEKENTANEETSRQTRKTERRISRTKRRISRSKKQRVIVPETPWNMIGEHEAWKCAVCASINSSVAMKCSTCSSRRQRSAAKKSRQMMENVLSIEEKDGSEHAAHIHEETAVAYLSEAEEQDDIMMAMALSLSECSKEKEAQPEATRKEGNH
mmetsp:Transcript_4798/g.11391  ORF Transcript_4798/g.11391 Transcript_4798/m.11391 type:complete len:540 (-) Transcript_4798:139-1758(-)